MKVGFYESKKHRMVEVEPWTEGLELARVASAHMTALFESGRHRLPSPIWCLWDGADVCSVFLLDGKSRSEQFLDKVRSLRV